MERHNLTISYQTNNLTRCDSEVQHLLRKAKEVSSKAFAPYSTFKVGAAVRNQEGSISIGNNQENAAYPSGLCAERVALFTAKAQGPTAIITEIAVFAPVKSPTCPSPCGSCRQTMIEYEIYQKQPIKIYLMNETEQVWIFAGVGDLLPFAFTATHLPGHS